MAERLIGFVHALPQTGRFGFLMDASRRQYFFAGRAVVNASYDDLRIGDTVEFDAFEDPKGPRAEYVELIERATVERDHGVVELIKVGYGFALFSARGTRAFFARADIVGDPDAVVVGTAISARLVPSIGHTAPRAVEISISSSAQSS